MTLLHSHIRNAKTSLCVLLTIGLTFSESVDAQATSEIRDPLRGLTFYSIQVSTDNTSDIQTVGSRFTETDRVTLGLSALFFDESDTVDDFVLWLRHNGPRRWFVGSIASPLLIHVDDDTYEYLPLHASSPDEASGVVPLVEKLEFSVSPSTVRAIARAGVVRLELQTLLGGIDKQLRDGEQESIAGFLRSARERHNELRNANL